MLPAIAQAQQAQLRFNQVLSGVQGPVNAFVSGLTDGLLGIVEGTKSVEEAFADMLKGIGAALVQEGTKMIAQYTAIAIARALAGMGGGAGAGGFSPTLITKGLDFSSAFRAEGGPVNKNSPYIVGERGPELFVPNSSGTVLSNQDSKAAMASYSRMSPEDQKAADKGEDPTATVSMTALQPIRMDTRVINGVEYATVEQMQEASRQPPPRAQNKVPRLVKLRRCVVFA